MGIIGFGGIFIRPNNRATLMEWYQKNLGIPTDDWGHMFPLPHSNNLKKEAYAVFSIFKESSDYFPTHKTYMINFMVEDLAQMKHQLMQNGIGILKEENSDYGYFIHIEDPEGNKIELWEPANKP